MSAAAMLPVSANAQAAQAWIQNSFPREKARIGQKPNRTAEDRRWLSERGIADGEWTFMSKPALESKMTPDNPLKVRVWAAGMLASIGYGGEMAVKLVGGKLEPLTAADIRRQLNGVAKNWLSQAGEQPPEEVMKTLYVQKAHVRRAIEQLEADEQCIRTLKEDGSRLRDSPPERRLGLQEGDVLLCFYFRPLPADSQRVKRTVDKIWLPEKERRNPRLQQVRSNLQALKLSWNPEAVAQDDYLSEQVRVAAEEAELARRVAIEKLESDPRVAAASTLIRNKELPNKVLKETSEERAPLVAPPAPEQPEVISQTLPSSKPEPNPAEPTKQPASISGLLHAVNQKEKSGPDYGQSEIPELQRIFSQLTPTERLTAIDTVLYRIKVGQYDGGPFTPSLKSYLLSKSWERKHRAPPGKKRGDTSFLDSFIPGESTNGDD